MPDSVRDARRRTLALWPKAELHVHLEGSIAPSLAVRLGARHGVALPAAIERAAAEGRAYRYADFSEFIQIFLATSGLLRTAADYHEVVVALGATLRAQGVVWAEVTFTPVTHLQRGVAEDVFMGGLASGRAAVREAGGPELRWVFDIVRHLPDQAVPTLEIALRHQDADTGRGVIGLGLGGPEAKTAPYEVYAPVFAKARAAGLWSLPHAGEHLGSASVRGAVEQLGAHRIGHGVRAVEDPEVVALVRDRDVTLEVCPRSNLALGVVSSLAEHPVDRLRAAGVHVVLGTDDPPLFDSVLLDEYLGCAETFGWDDGVMAELCRQSLRSSTMRELDAERLNVLLGPGRLPPQ